MIDAVIAASLRHRVHVLALAVALLAFGSWRAIHMPVDVFPDLTAPTVTVVSEAHGMAPEEVEQRVTFPIEAALNGATGVRRVRSSSGVGISVVWVEFEWGTEVFRARQIVAEKLQLVRAQLPTEIEPPVLAPISSVMGEVLFVALTSDRHSRIELRTMADFTLRRRLLGVSGVSQVIALGGDRRQYQVLFDPERLDAIDLAPSELADALSGTNRSVSAGFLDVGGEELLVHGAGRVHPARAIDDIGQTVVAVREEVPIRARDLAEVREGAAPNRGDASFDGHPAVVIGIQKQPGVHTLELMARLDAELDALEASLPEGMSLHRHVFRQSDFIEVAVDNVVAALRDGALLVLLVVLLFLASFRASVVTVVAIPLSMLAAILVLDALGATLNTMTLGGLAIAVGELVDDAVIDVENVVRRLRENGARPEAERRPAMAVVLAASREIRSSIVFATLVVALVFLPLFALSGIEGRLLAPLAIAYVVSLLASLLVALTVTPVLASFLLPRARTVVRGREPWVVTRLRAAYAPLLARTMPRWRAVIAVAAIALVVALFALARTGQGFLPEFHEGTLTLAAVTLPGTSLEQSNAIGRRIEEILLAHPEVVGVARRTGRAEQDEHAQGVYASELDVGLRDTERPREELLADLRRELTAVPGTTIVIGQPISHRVDHMLSGTRANLAVKIFGDDLATLRGLAAEVERAMQDIDGVVDLAIEQQVDIPFARVRFDRAALARHGLRVEDAADALELATVGVVVSEVLDGQAAYDVVVRQRPDSVSDLTELAEVRVIAPSGARIPLRTVADVRRDVGPNEIGREGVERRMVVMCNVAGRDLRSVVDDVRATIERDVELPAGYRVAYGGQIESAESASRTLFFLALASIAAIFLLLATAFGSSRDALLVMLNLPLALIGGVAGVYVAGGVVSIASLVGFITLFGIATRNGIMLVTHVRHLVVEEGVRDAAEAVRRGAEERLAPILMTALAAGLALVPLALAGGEPGSEIQSPMAIVILFGLSSSTLLNMIVVPAMVLRFGSVRDLVAARLTTDARPPQDLR
ncbi:MAG: efflux RND transporter permease subunit [Myxococcota bacterium]|nr:efflux RND transporter permease subunit [Myxococcota bacterium]